MVSCDYVPKPQLMATYFEKLSRIFWVSENYLFHAYAYYKFFALSATQNKALSEDDRRAMASAVVLGALAIPIYASAGPAVGIGASGEGGLDVDGERDKKSKLAALLKHPTLPSREALLSELVTKGLLNFVRPDVRELFCILQVDFSPLTLVERARPILEGLRDETRPTVSATGTVGSSSGAASIAANALAQYVPNLERLLVFRLLQQLSSVFSTLRLSVFNDMCTGLSLNPLDVQKLIARSVKAGQLAVRMDHRTGVLRLGSHTSDATAMRRQLSELAARLHAVVESLAVDAGTPAADAQAAAAAEHVIAAKRAALVLLAQNEMEGSPERTAARKAEIERRKEDDDWHRFQTARVVSMKGTRGGRAPGAGLRRADMHTRKKQQWHAYLSASPLPIFSSCHSDWTGRLSGARGLHPCRCIETRAQHVSPSPYHHHHPTSSPSPCLVPRVLPCLLARASLPRRLPPLLVPFRPKPSASKS